MAKNVVNLDAMIVRDDMAIEHASDRPPAQTRTTMSILDLDGGFLATGLRKPDFQRETTNWGPDKVVGLIMAFVYGDLIPAVILWQRGAHTFVIDGAHRLSALIAWIRDDYGDRSHSLEFFGPQLPPEQIAVAEKTRKEVDSSIGPYSTFKGLAATGADTSESHRKVIDGLANNSLVVQWVPASDAASAERSFFTINQAAQPIDPTERRILQARKSANAIAARCLVRGGKGHKYWAGFPEAAQAQIEELGEEVYDALFRPPMSEPLTTLDLPVAGRGYNQLPLAFDLVNICNNIPLPARSDTKRIGGAPEPDTDGSQTIAFLKAVRKRVRLVTSKHAGSFGLHPAVYFYAISGNFLPNAFLATMEFAARIVSDRQRNEFVQCRRKMEDYLFKNKVFVSLTVTKLGSGSRSLGRLAELYWRVFRGSAEGLADEELTGLLFDDPDFSFLKQSQVPPPRTARGRTGKMSGATKSAVMLREGYRNVSRCAVCGAAAHFRSVTVDHAERRTAGGSADMRNGQITHPYCNSGYKS